MSDTSIEDRPLFEVAGWKVYFLHMATARIPEMDLLNELGGLQHLPPAKGLTLCHLISEQVAYSATARCGLKDHFNKATGRKIALKHVLEAHFARDQRAWFWREYFTAIQEFDKAIQVATLWHLVPSTDEEVL